MTTQEILEQKLGNRLFFNEPLKRHTTFKIGGPARFFIGLFDHYLWSLQSGRWILFFGIVLYYQTEFLTRKKEELKA